MRKSLKHETTFESFSWSFNKFVQIQLFIKHYHLNDVDVLIDENYEVTAMIDWEMSSPVLPLGAGFGRNHALTDEYNGG